jgi:hypothetical protein
LGFSLKKGKEKIAGKWRFLKAEHVAPADRISFQVADVLAVPEPAQGQKKMNLTMILLLTAPVCGDKIHFPVSRTNWLMLAESWPHDDTDTLKGSTVTLRIITQAGKGQNEKPYSALHFEEITEKGGKKPIKIKELPRRIAGDDEDIPPPHGDTDIPF